MALGGVKLQVLFSMLAVASGEVVTSGRLIDALWGETPPRTADTGLRVNVARLRDVLSSLLPPAPGVVHRPPGYVLLVDSARIDIVRFQSLLAAAAHSDPAEARELLESALSLWRGEPFGGSCDHDVLRVEGERLRELYEVALEDRVGVLMSLGEHETAISHLEGLVRVQPLRERRTLLLMRALYRTGRQADALRAFRRLRRVLADELGLTPTPELQAAEQAILAHDPSLEPWRARTSAPLGPVGLATPLPWWLVTAMRTRMLGREEQLDRLLGLVDRFAGGSGEAVAVHILLLAGDAGVGKTRLLAECVKHAGSRGVRVLAGWCDPGAVVPFRPLMEAFRQVVAEGSGAYAPPASRIGWFVARYLTEDAAGQRRTDPETDRLRFFEAMARLLEDASESGPVLLAVDDIHWLDPSSAALLRYLLRRPARNPVILVACYRSDPDEFTSAWRQTLGQLRQEGACYLLDVDELSADASAQLITELAADRGIPNVDELTPRILPVTGGNPLFVREVMTQLALDGSESSTSVGGVPVPPTMLSAVADRLHRVSASTQGVLNAAAVLGRRFSLEDAAVVAGCTVEAVMQAVEEARNVRLIDEVPDLFDEFTFRHGLLREAVYDLMPRSRRLRLHAAAGAAFEDKDDVSSVLARAWHLLEAVPVCPAETAASAAVDAADAALNRLAFEETSRLVHRSLQVVPVDTPTGRLLRWELLIRLGRACAYRGANASSDEAFAAAADVARELEDPARLAIAALGDDLDTRALTPSPARLDLIADGMRALGDVVTPLRVALASTYVALGSRTYGAGFVRPVAEDTVRLARQLGEPLSLSKALLAWTVCTGSTVPATDRLGAATEALSLADSAGHPTRAARARLTRVGCLLRLGRADEAAEEHGRFRVLAERSQVPRHLWHADVVGAALDRMRGDFTAAQACAERALAVGERAEIAEASMAFGAHTFFMHWHQGTLGEVREAVDAFAKSRPHLRLWTLAAGLTATADGDERTGRHLLEEFLSIVSTLDPGDEFWSNELVMAAQLVWDLGVDGPEVQVLRSRLLSCRGQFDVFGAASGTFGPVDRVLGLLAERRGEHEESRALLSGAWELCGRMHAAPWAVWTGRDLATQLWATGRAAEARRAAAAVLPTAERLGLTVNSLGPQLRGANPSSEPP